MCLDHPLPRKCDVGRKKGWKIHGWRISHFLTVASYERNRMHELRSDDLQIDDDKDLVGTFYLQLLACIHVYNLPLLFHILDNFADELRTDFHTMRNVAPAVLGRVVMQMLFSGDYTVEEISDVVQRLAQARIPVQSWMVFGSGNAPLGEGEEETLTPREFWAVVLSNVVTMAFTYPERLGSVYSDSYRKAVCVGRLLNAV